MTLDDEIQILKQQEEKLQFSVFNAETAWAIGSNLHALAAEDSRAAAMGIWMSEQTLFYAATAGATPNNENWLRRKRNAVLKLGKSTYRIGRELEKAGVSLEEKQGLPHADYASHGGGFPIVLKGSGCVGAIVFSGYPQKDDHNLVVQVIADFLRVDVPKLS